MAHTFPERQIERLSQRHILTDNSLGLADVAAGGLNPLRGKLAVVKALEKNDVIYPKTNRFLICSIHFHTIQCGCLQQYFLPRRRYSRHFCQRSPTLLGSEAAPVWICAMILARMTTLSSPSCCRLPSPGQVPPAPPEKKKKKKKIEKKKEKNQKKKREKKTSTRGDSTVNSSHDVVASKSTWPYQIASISSHEPPDCTPPGTAGS